MNRHITLLVGLVFGLASSCGPSWAAKVAPHRIDPATTPITADQVAKQLGEATRNADLMVTALRRAEANYLELQAWETMRKLKSAQPKNAVVLGGFCLAMQMAAHRYNSHPPRTAGISVTNEMQAEYTDALRTAYKLDKRCYIAPVVYGWASTYQEGPSAGLYRNRGLKMLRKQRDLHPDKAWVQYEFGMAASFVAGAYGCPEGKAALETATRLAQPVAHAALMLSSYTPDMPRAQHEKCLRLYRSLLDPRYVIPPEVKRLNHIP